MEEKVEICIINEGRKNSILIRSEEQVAQRVENRAKIVIAKVESDESTTVDSDIWFEIPTAEVGFLTNITY